MPPLPHINTVQSILHRTRSIVDTFRLAQGVHYMASEL